MKKPLFTTLAQAGCPACAAAKPLLAEFRERYEDTFRFEQIDPDQKKVPYDDEIKRFPTFRVETECGAQYADPKSLPGGLSFESLETWAIQALGSCPYKPKAKKGRKKRGA